MAEGNSHTLPTVLYLINLLFLLVSLGVPHWSHGEATKANESGDVTIGLWAACGDLPNERVFNQDPTTTGDCRLGHCITSVFITSEACAFSNGLCESSKGSAAFTILATVMTLAAIWKTKVKLLFKERPSHGWAAFFNFITCLSSLIAWSIWVGWQESFNSEVDCTDPQPIVVFDKLVPGAGVALNICVMLMALALIFLERKEFSILSKEELEQEEAKARQRSQSQQPLTDTPSQSDIPLDEISERHDSKA